MLKTLSVVAVAAAAVAVAAIVAFPVRTEAGPRTAAQVLADVQKTYAAVNDMSAAFEQRVTNQVFGRTAVSGGKVWLRRPAKMRWDYTDKARAGKPAKLAKSFVSDGTTLHVVNLQTQQIITSPVQANLLPVAVAFLSGTATWTADFQAKLDASGTYGTKDDHVVVLTPKAPSAAYKRLYLVVDSTTRQVRESIIIDAADNTNHFLFSGADLAAKNKDTYFAVDLANPMFAGFRVVNASPPPSKPAKSRAAPRTP